MSPRAGAALHAVRVADGVESRLAAAGCRVALVTRDAARIATPDGLATIVHARAGGVPNGISVVPLPDLRRCGVRAGAPARRSGDHLVLGDGSVTVRVTGGAPWSSGLAQGCLSPGSAVRRTLAAADAAASASLAPARSDSGTTGTARATKALTGDALDATLSAVAAGDPAAAARAAAPLIGLGAGLTPSGDDVLIGLVAALWAGAHPAAAPFAQACAKRARGATTYVSVDLLEHAAAGRFVQRVTDVVAALARGAVAATVDASAALAAMGGTSGADTLLGLRAGIDLLLRQQPGRAA